MNGVRKVKPLTDKELRIFVFCRLSFTTSTKYYGFSLGETSKGLLASLLLVLVAPYFPPVEFSLTE